MIDLHSHILPGIDDGASSEVVSIEMARMAVADGITDMACTPHVLAGKYPNTSETILPAIEALQKTLDRHGIPLKLHSGADIHIAPDLAERLAGGNIPTLNFSRYFLLEPPHEVLPPRLKQFAARTLEAGFIPIITHPERLLWAHRHFDVIQQLNDLGCPLQITADSILGGFGSGARKLAERIVKDGRMVLFATDAHSEKWRKPLMSQAYKTVSELVGGDEAEHMFHHRPADILANADLNAGARPPKPAPSGEGQASFARRVIEHVLRG